MGISVPSEGPQRVRLGDVDVRLDELVVASPRGNHPLTTLEVAFLRHMIAQRGATVAREQLLAEVWGYASRSVTRAVDNTVSRLRKKIELDPSKPVWLVSTRGGGYRLELDPADAPRAIPADPDAFVGRVRELDAVAGAFADGARLVTLLGLGGIGKTRLALAFARMPSARFPGGTWFCDLGEARDVDGIVAALSSVLGGAPRPGASVAVLGADLAQRGACLVVLDNFEQLGAFAGETVSAWLRAAPELRILVTTRVRLGVGGETVIDVPPLDPTDAEELFVRRARAVSRGVLDVPSQREAVAPLVAVLDGLPLAIELAAARVAVLGPKELLARVSDRFRLLADGGGRETVRATLDWSWELLTAEEQRGLAQLSVFEGGFGVDAAEAVLDVGGAWPLDVLQVLVDRSLVRRVGDRLRLLALVQAYARQRLADAGLTEAAEQRHGAHFAGYGTDAVYEALDDPDSDAWTPLRDNLDNLVAACRRACARGDGPVAADTAGAAWRVFERTGPVSLGLALLDAALVLDHPPFALARLRNTAAWACRLVGQPDRALAHHRAAVAVYSQLPTERKRLGRAYSAMAGLYVTLGEAALAREQFGAALTILQELGDRRSEGIARGNLGMLELDARNLGAARGHLTEALALHREVGNRRSEGVVCLSLGLLASDEGRLDEAYRQLQDAVALARASHNTALHANATCAIGLLHAAQGRFDEARALFDEAVALAETVGAARTLGQLVNERAWFLAQAGDPHRALAEFDRAIGLCRRVGNLQVQGAAQCGIGAARALAGDPRGAREALEAGIGLAREATDPRLLGCALGWLAEVQLALGARAAARQCADEAVACLRPLGVPYDLGCALSVLARVDSERGAGALAEAEAIAVQLGASPPSLLGTRLERARRAIHRADA